MLVHAAACSPAPLKHPRSRSAAGSPSPQTVPPLPAPQALQWLRHGCLPVIVVEGEAPEEKRVEQQVGACLAMCFGGLVVRWSDVFSVVRRPAEVAVG